MLTNMEGWLHLTTWFLLFVGFISLLFVIYDKHIPICKIWQNHTKIKAAYFTVVYM